MTAGNAPKTRKLSISSAERAARVERVREELEKRGLDALVLFHPQRIGYLSSFVFVSTERPMALVVPVRGELGMLIPQLEQEHVSNAPEIADVQVYPEYPSGPGGRHPHTRILRRDTDNHLAGGWIAFDHRTPPATQICFSCRLAIQAHGNFLGGRIRAVTDVTLVGENRPNIAIKTRRLRRGQGTHDRHIQHGYDYKPTQA